MNKISVVINTFNEEKNITQCLNSVKWADEIVIVDMHSTDKTREIAKKYTKHIFLHENVGYVEPARNFAISKAHGDWILVLDADEEISEELAKTLQKIPQERPDVSIVALPRKNIIFGKWIQHSGWWPDHLIRFFKKGTVTWKNAIHSQPETKGEVVTLDHEDNAILHHNYETISQFLYKNLLVYPAREAEELLRKGYIFDYRDAIRFPLKEFLSRYFAREGYKDGFHGLVLAIFMAMYHFIIFANLWEKNKFIDETDSDVFKGIAKELRKSKRDIAFWMSKKSIDEEKNLIKKVGLKVRKKLRL